MKISNLLRRVAVVAFVMLAVSSAALGADLSQNEVDEIVKGVEKGDADAQLRLGVMYFMGQNVKKDHEQAAYWLKKSYEQGNVEAQFLFALLELDNENKNKTQAFYLIKQVAEKNPSTINKVYGIEESGKKIYSSAEEMVAAAQCVVGEMYYRGEGTEKDYEQAEYWLRKSLEHGSAFVQERAKANMAEAAERLEKIRAEKDKRSQTSTSTVQPKPAPSNSGNVLEINFELAFKECRDNGLVYKLKYDGKKVRVTEKIYAIGTEPLTDKIFVRLSYKENQIGLDDFDDLYCFFEDSDADSIMKLKAGQIVTIEGTCKEHSILPFTLEKCRIVSVNDSNTSSRPLPDEKPQSVIEIGIKQLLKEHDENKVAAKRKYNDKKLRLSGFISNIDENSGKIYVSLAEEKNSWDTIRCYFNNDDEAESVMQLKEGQSVIIEGTCRSGENMFGKTIAQLQNCRVINANNSGNAQKTPEHSAPQTQTSEENSDSEQFTIPERPYINYKLTDDEYKQFMKNADFANADKALNAAWKKAKNSLSTFNTLKKEQNEWISSGRDNEASELINNNMLSKIVAYTMVTQARANYIAQLSKGNKIAAASVLGDKVNVRSQPNTKSKVLFQVNRYLRGGETEEHLIIDSNPVNGEWYKVLYRYQSRGGDSWYDKANGYINGRFIQLEPLSDFDLMMIDQ